MYSFKPSSCNLIFAKWFSETSLNEAVNCNTVVFSQALIYIILNQSSLCSMYQTVTWWITHTHKFLVHHQQKIKRYLSSEIKNTSYVCENINKPCSRNSYSYLCLLQVHPEVHHTAQDPSGVPEWSFHHPVLQAPLSWTSDKEWKSLMCAWSYMVRIQPRHALNF